MGDIVTSVKRVTDIIADITTASREHSVGIEQVNQAITQMDENTRQNVALVEEATAAARSPGQQSEQLVMTVAVFLLGAGHQSAAAPAPTPGAAEPGVTSIRTATHRVAAFGSPAKRPAHVLRQSSARAATSQNWQEFQGGQCQPAHHTRVAGHAAARRYKSSGLSTPPAPRPSTWV